MHKMKFKKRWLAAILLTSMGISSSVDAAANATSDEDMLNSIYHRANELEQEARNLRQQVRQVSHQKLRQDKLVHPTTRDVNPLEQVDANTVVNADLDYTREFKGGVLPHIPALLYLGGTPVTVSPYIGVRSEFDASDLIVNIPPVNEDLRLLLQWQKLEGEFKKYHQPVPSRPFVDLSGKVESQVIWTKPYTGRKNSDIDLSGAEVDIVAHVNNWAVGFLSLKYDNSQLNPTRTANSKVFLNKGFVTLGDLDIAPVYGTIGQAYVPFGLYASNMLSSPLTQSLARTKARFIGLGYAEPTGERLYGFAYTFRGDSSVNTPNNRLNQGGVNVGYKYVCGDWSADVGGGYIASLTDSEGMQATGSPFPGFSGFGATFASESLDHQVPGADVRGNFGYGPFSLLTEYITATRHFTPGDMTYDTHGAKPSALNVEGSYSFHILNRPTSISIGFQNTKQALALVLPEKRYIATLNASVWKSTIASLEYRHDINYALGDTASGAGVPMIFTPTTLGKTSDVVTAQFGLYF